MSRPEKYDQDEHQKIAVATRLTAKRWADSIRDGQRPPDLAETTALAASAGVRDPEAVGRELAKLMHETYVGLINGAVPPKRQRDRLRGWWSGYKAARADRRPS